jgi:hypothetical protein
MPKIPQRRRAPRKLRILCNVSFKYLPQRASNLQQRTRVEKFGNRKHGSGHRKSREPLLWIRERSETQLRTSAQISSRLAHQNEFRIKRRYVLLRNQRLNRATSGHTSGISADNFFQLVKFQNLRS